MLQRLLHQEPFTVAGAMPVGNTYRHCAMADAMADAAAATACAMADATASAAAADMADAMADTTGCAMFCLGDMG